MILTRKLHKNVLAELDLAGVDVVKKRLEKCLSFEIKNETTLKWINYYETYIHLSEKKTKIN
jgi:hypothetical protein